MPSGGKRPGAGAPRGNINAIKHGAQSKQALAILLRGSVREWREFLSRMRQAKSRKNHSSE